MKYAQFVCDLKNGVLYYVPDGIGLGMDFHYRSQLPKELIVDTCIKEVVEEPNYYHNSTFYSYQTTLLDLASHGWEMVFSYQITDPYDEGIFRPFYIFKKV